MKAAVLVATGSPLEIWRDLEIPSPRSGQVLVKLAYSGVCHSQLMEVRGGRGPDAFLPHLLGHEATGVVVSIGVGVGKVRPGQAVVLGWIKGSGSDAGGVRYSSSRGVVNAGAVTTFNEFALVSENRCVPLPRDVPLDVGVTFGCAIPTGAGIVVHSLAPKPNSTLAVFGLGGIGLSALLATRLFNCAQVIAVDVSAEKLQLARSLGATATIDAGREDPVAVIRELTQGLGVDYAVEASGRARTIEQAFDAVKRGGGTCIFASHPARGEKIALDPYELISGKRIMGSWGGESRPDTDIPMFGSLYQEGKLPLERLMGTRYSLEDINRALDDLEARKTVRPILEIDPDLRPSA